MQNDDEICKERDDFSMKFVFIFFIHLKINV